MLAVKGRYDGMTVILEKPPAIRECDVIVNFPDIPESAEKTAKTPPRVTRAQINEWSKAPELQALVGILKGADLPPDITMKDVRQMRLEEKYQL